MAKALKPDEAQKARGVSAADMKRIVTNINKAKEKAAEHVGEAGHLTKQAVDDYNLDKKALTFVSGLARKEVAQQQATLRAIIDYANKLGMFASIDMFDDLIPVLQGIVAQAEKTSSGPKPVSEKSATVTSLLTPAH